MTLNGGKLIGVLTFSNAVDNYGQVLQYLATQEYLRSLGYCAALLLPSGHRENKTRPNFIKRSYLRFRNLAARVKRHIIRPMSVQSAMQSEPPKDEIAEKKNAEFKRWMDSIDRNEKIHPRFFNDFKNKYFNMFKGTYEDVLEYGFEYFCVGSDQTWSGPGGYYLFDWVPDGYKRFSIAPSVGHWQFNDSQLSAYKKYLPRFSFVTVREDNGLELCRQCGRLDVQRILDPTLLLSSDDYDKYSLPVKADKPYALLYMLGGEIAVDIGDIIKFCEEQGLEVKYVASQGREDDYPKCYAQVGEWLSLVKGAKYIFTNSFHGMAFSIIYRKQFLVFPLVGIMADMNGRVMGLASQMNLRHRLYDGDMSAVFSPVDWCVTDEVIQSNKHVLNGLMERLK